MKFHAIILNILLLNYGFYVLAFIALLLYFYSYFFFYYNFSWRILSDNFVGLVILDFHCHRAPLCVFAGDIILLPIV